MPCTYGVEQEKRGMLMVWFLILAILGFFAGTSEAAAPARSVPYTEAICRTDPNVVFCEDFDGAANDIVFTGNTGGQAWNNPAISNPERTSAIFGGCRQRSTLPIAGFNQTSNRVWRIRKSGGGCVDMVSGWNSGTGDGGLKGFLNSVGSNGLTDYYVRWQSYWSTDSSWPADIDFKLFVGLPISGWNPSSPTDAWWSHDTGMWQDYWCPSGNGFTNFNDVILFRYSGRGGASGLQEFPTPGDSAFCPPVAPGGTPTLGKALRMAKNR